MLSNTVLSGADREPEMRVNTSIQSAEAFWPLLARNQEMSPHIIVGWGWSRQSGALVALSSNLLQVRPKTQEEKTKTGILSQQSLLKSGFAA